MQIFLKLKHWQLFGLIFLTIVLFEFFFVGSIIATRNLSVAFGLFPVMMLLSTGLLFGWFYSMGTNLYPKLPESVTMNLRLFKIFMAVPFCYIFLICLAIGAGRYVYLQMGLEEVPNALFAFIPLIVILHLFSMFCILYTMRFVAKVLKSVECQKEVHFSDYIGEFFLLWFYPVGIWILQPRINKIFSQEQTAV